ncbi:MAG: ABC transporter permease [Lachnospiraceae bacterium]|nr:ABC transporter permease [Lachnospiraceae bacterium]
MPQKLSAMKYIRNNKRRVSVLIVSLCLCFVLTYLTQFLLSSLEETVIPIVMENTKKIQYVSIAGSSFGLDIENLDEEEFNRQYQEKNLELAERLKKHKEISEVYYAQILYVGIAATVGNMTVEMPCVSKQEIPVLLKHFDAEILEGRLPEKEGEVVLDEASMKNNGYSLNDIFNEEGYGKSFRIVGVLDCDSYFGCGIPSETYSLQRQLAVLSDGSIKDMSKVLQKEGIHVRDAYDKVLDYKWGKWFVKNEISDVLGNSGNLVYTGIILILTVSLFLVYTTYLRDRHNEWCLYCSIGYSRKSIFFSILRELLFTFAVALLIGIILISGSVVLLDYAMIQPKGIRCRYFQPETLKQILCTYILLLGVLQIPVRYALYRIRTIDAIDDELF